MKRILMMVFVGVFFFGAAAHATLIQLQNSSGHVVFDDNTGQYWIWDLSIFSNQTYNEVLNQIEILNTSDYFNIDDWALATQAEMESLWLYSGTIIGTSFGYAGEYHYDPVTTMGVRSWDGRWEGRPSGDTHYVAHLYNAGGPYYSKNDDITYTWMKDSDIHNRIGAWVTSSSSPVPEPATLFLLGTGLTGLAAARRRKKQ